MYHNALNILADYDSFNNTANDIKDPQQLSSLQHPLINNEIMFTTKYQFDLYKKYSPTPPASNASGASTSQAFSSQSNLHEPSSSSPKASPVKMNCSKGINIPSFGQDDSDTPTVKSQGHAGEGNKSHYANRNDSTSGTSESLSGCSSNSIPSACPKQKIQQQAEGGITPRMSTRESKQYRQQGLTTIHNFQNKSKVPSIPKAAPVMAKENQGQVKNEIFLREIPIGKRETAPFEYTHEWNTYLSDSLLINSMKQMNEEEQLQFRVEQEDDHHSNSPNSFKNQGISAENNSLITNSATETKGHLLALHIRENDQKIEILQPNRHTTLTLSVKTSKKISKKKKQKDLNKQSNKINRLRFLKSQEDSHQLTRGLNSQDSLSYGGYSEGEADQREGRKSFSSSLNHHLLNKRHSSNKQEHKRKYYIQDPEIENYVGSEFQAVIPDIIPGYRPQLYTLKYDHSKVTQEHFKQVMEYLQETYGKHVTEEDVANIIIEAGYDMNKVNELLEEKKFTYELYFLQQKRLHNQRKGQIKRIGTLKRRRKNVLTL